MMMKSLTTKVLFVQAILIASLAIAVSASMYELEDELSFFSSQQEIKTPTSVRGMSSRFLSSRSVKTATCDRNPRLCGGGSHHCCHKKCVDLKTDNLNCGKCGVKSHHSQICCKGHLVNPMADKKHCGSCDNHCQRGTSCALGMCSYA